MFVITFSEIMGVIVVLFVVTIIPALHIINWLKYRNCKHDGGVNETSSCDAICRKCYKNLGFIGAWREKVLRERE